MSKPIPMTARQWAARNPRLAAVAAQERNGEQEPDGFRDWLGEAYPANTGLGWKAIPDSIKSQFRQEKKTQ